MNYCSFPPKIFGYYFILFKCSFQQSLSMWALAVLDLLSRSACGSSCDPFSLYTGCRKPFLCLSGKAIHSMQTNNQSQPFPLKERKKERKQWIFLIFLVWMAFQTQQFITGWAECIYGPAFFWALKWLHLLRKWGKDPVHGKTKQKCALLGPLRSSTKSVPGTCVQEWRDGMGS